MSIRRATAADLAGIIALQGAAYARNLPLLGVEPLPLLVDYADILQTHEVWLAESERLDGVLILKAEADHLLIWSIATAPGMQRRGLGKTLLAKSEVRAHELSGSVACASIQASRSKATSPGTSGTASCASASSSLTTAASSTW
jgi:N-acetylglutamate synthase-like GNAT family acetyltransferase